MQIFPQGKSKGKQGNTSDLLPQELGWAKIQCPESKHLRVAPPSLAIRFRPPPFGRPHNCVLLSEARTRSYAWGLGSEPQEGGPFMISHWVEGSPRASPQPPRSVMMTTHNVSRVTHIFSLKPHHASRKKKAFSPFYGAGNGRSERFNTLPETSQWVDGRASTQQITTTTTLIIIVTAALSVLLSPLQQLPQT